MAAEAARASALMALPGTEQDTKTLAQGIKHGVGDGHRRAHTANSPMPRALSGHAADVQ